MHRLLIRIVLLSVLFLGLSLGLAAKIVDLRLLHAHDRDLVFQGYGYTYRKQPVTAIVYELGPGYRPKHLFFTWKGRYVGHEYQWYDNGQIFSDWSYRDGLPHGSWKMWHPDGTAKSLKTFVAGQAHGEEWAWHPNGQVSDFNLWDQGRELTHKAWISDGTPYYNYVYQDGKKVGVKGGEFCKRLERIRR